jgi:putative hydrolase of HD superfamily
MMTFVAFVMGKLDADVDLAKLLSMCLLHDLPEARTGDLNAVQKKYVQSDENLAISELADTLPFGKEYDALMAEFNRRESRESRLAHDADQIAFLLDLKALADIGYETPDKWIDHVKERIQTDIGKKTTNAILDTKWDGWWLRDF